MTCFYTLQVLQTHSEALLRFIVKDFYFCVSVTAQEPLVTNRWALNERNNACIFGSVDIFQDDVIDSK